MFDLGIIFHSIAINIMHLYVVWSYRMNNTHHICFMLEVIGNVE